MSFFSVSLLSLIFLLPIISVLFLGTLLFPLLFCTRPFCNWLLESYVCFMLSGLFLKEPSRSLQWYGKMRACSLIPFFRCVAFLETFPICTLFTELHAVANEAWRCQAPANRTDLHKNRPLQEDSSKMPFSNN